MFSLSKADSHPDGQMNKHYCTGPPVTVDMDQSTLLPSTEDVSRIRMHIRAINGRSSLSDVLETV